MAPKQVRAPSLACFKGDAKVIKLLIRRTFDPNEEDYRGYTALFYAVLGCTTDAVKLFLEEGADITFRRSDGQTMLRSAAFSKRNQENKTAIENNTAASKSWPRYQ
jgi:ankyrin repeat protein